MYATPSGAAETNKVLTVEDEEEMLYSGSLISEEAPEAQMANIRRPSFNFQAPSRVSSVYN